MEVRSRPSNFDFAKALCQTVVEWGYLVVGGHAKRTKPHLTEKL